VYYTNSQSLLEGRNFVTCGSLLLGTSYWLFFSVTFPCPDNPSAFYVNPCLRVCFWENAAETVLNSIPLKLGQITLISWWVDNCFPPLFKCHMLWADKNIHKFSLGIMSKTRLHVIRMVFVISCRGSKPGSIRRNPAKAMIWLSVFPVYMGTCEGDLRFIRGQESHSTH
jgi:hypothetical protein